MVFQALSRLSQSSLSRVPAGRRIQEAARWTEDLLGGKKSVACETDQRQGARGARSLLERLSAMLKRWFTCSTSANRQITRRLQISNEMSASV